MATKAAVKGQIAIVIKDNTTGTDFITPTETKDSFDAVVDNALFPDDIPAYDDRAAATTALGTGKVFKATGFSSSLQEGVLCMT